MFLRGYLKSAMVLRGRRREEEEEVGGGEEEEEEAKGPRKGRC